MATLNVHAVERTLRALTRSDILTRPEWGNRPLTTQQMAVFFSIYVGTTDHSVALARQFYWSTSAMNLVLGRLRDLGLIDTCYDRVHQKQRYRGMKLIRTEKGNAMMRLIMAMEDG